MGFTLLQTRFTNYCADTVEWCPVDPFWNYFICGTYQLQASISNSSTEKTAQIRIGQLHLFSVTKFLQLNLHCTIESSSGILDCKWNPRRVSSDSPTFVTVSANGKIILWELNIGDEDAKLNALTELELDSRHVLLSVDWCEDGSHVCVSDSAGCISIVRLNENSTLDMLHKFEVHTNEAWTVTFGIDNIFSGADDSLLKITDLRSGKLISQLREHSGGVTSIRFSRYGANVFASGSYDETVKLWDARNTSKSMFTLDVGGGIWRIKWDPQDARHILIAGMYSGGHWLDYDSNTNVLTMEYSLKEHSTICYGADICYMSSQKIKSDFKHEYCENDTNRLHRLIATCSFYDKKLCLSLI